jgi:hypothetical protein
MATFLRGRRRLSSGSRRRGRGRARARAGEDRRGDAPARQGDGRARSDELLRRDAPRARADGGEARPRDEGRRRRGEEDDPREHCHHQYALD